MNLNCKKKYCYLILAILLVSIVSLISACGKKDSDSADGTNKMEVENVSLSFQPQNEKEDSQPYWNALHHPMAKGENGYYYLDKEPKLDMIRFFDPEDGIDVPVCGKPDCQHNNITCNAVLDKNSSYFRDLYYYKGYIYVMREEAGSLILVQISQDGAERKDLFEINMPTRPSGDSSIGLIFYDDSVYIYDYMGRIGQTEEGEVSIRCRSLDGKKDEIIYTYTGIGCFIDAAKIYNGKLFFCLNEGTTDSQTQKNKLDGKGLYVYDIKEKTVGVVLDEPVIDYAIDTENNILYYFVAYDGLYKMDFATGNKQLITKAADDTMICRLSFDGQYLYLDNGRWKAFGIVKCANYMITLTLQGNEINRLQVDTAYFGDADYAFAFGGTKGHFGIQYLDKKDIDTVKEWTFIPGK